MTMQPETPVADLSYEQAVDELEDIVADLDTGNADIDTLSVRFARAIEIVENLNARIEKARKQVDKLAPRLDKLSSRPEETGDETE